MILFFGQAPARESDKQLEVQEIDRRDDKVFSCTTEVVKAVIELNKGASNADANSLVQFITVNNVKMSKPV